MAKSDLHTFVIPLSQALAAEMGFEMIDAELVKEGPGRYLRVYLDKEGGITLDDCEKFHRAVQPKLEPVDYDFLEISSPGVDRPLKTDRDFARALNTQVEVTLYKPVNGVKSLVGTLAGYDAETFLLLTASGERAMNRRDAAVIRPVIVFEEDEGGGEK
ncbi:MAG: ribosome maturation factor RimP [Firmicutes bacterium]|nr:ribosome maturation factor RimP [Bacillota bacterium]